MHIPRDTRCTLVYILTFQDVLSPSGIQGQIPNLKFPKIQDHFASLSWFVMYPPTSIAQKTSVTHMLNAHWCAHIHNLIAPRYKRKSCWSVGKTLTAPRYTYKRIPSFRWLDRESKNHNNRALVTTIIQIGLVFQEGESAN